MLDIGCGAVANPEPDHSRWKTTQDAQIPEVSVFRHNDVAVVTRIPPDIVVGCALQADQRDVRSPRIDIVELANQMARQVVIEQEPHGVTMSVCCSRSAAYARQARISSRVRSGKSASTSSILAILSREVTYQYRSEGALRRTIG